MTNHDFFNTGLSFEDNAYLKQLKLVGAPSIKEDDKRSLWKGPSETVAG